MLQFVANLSHVAGSRIPAAAYSPVYSFIGSFNMMGRLSHARGPRYYSSECPCTQRALNSLDDIQILSLFRSTGQFPRVCEERPREEMSLKDRGYSEVLVGTLFCVVATNGESLKAERCSNLVFPLSPLAYLSQHRKRWRASRTNWCNFKLLE